MSSSTKIDLDLSGFSEILKEIEKAEKTLDRAAEECLNKVIDLSEDALQRETMKVTDSPHLVKAIVKTPAKWPKSGYGDVVTGGVGWKKGSYDPKNPSEGYKAVFLNYGTPRRKRSQIKGRLFIQKAKKVISQKTGSIYEQTLNDILKGLK